MQPHLHFIITCTQSTKTTTTFPGSRSPSSLVVATSIRREINAVFFSVHVHTKYLYTYAAGETSNTNQFSNKKRWQPLLESDGLGYISTQEHVTPHIGMTGRFFGFKTADEEASFASRKLDKPSYRNRLEMIGLPPVRIAAFSGN